MKNYSLIILSLIILGCNATTSNDQTPQQNKTATFYGHWKCDGTGSMELEGKNGDLDVIPISKYYTDFQVSPWELKFSENKEFTSIYTQKGAIEELNGTFEEIYGGEPKIIEVSFVGRKGDVEKMKIKFLFVSSSKIKISMHGESEVLYLNMDKI